MNEEIKEDYVSYPLAVLLRSFGFDLECHSYFNGDEIVYGNMFNYNLKEATYKNDVPNTKVGTIKAGSYIVYSRPTLALVVNWLRVKYNLHVWVDTVDGTEWVWTINRMNGDYIQSDDRGIEKTYKSSKEAYEAAIEYALLNSVASKAQNAVASGSLVEDAMNLPPETLAQAFEILFGPRWKSTWPLSSKAHNMRSIIRGGDQPCVPFINWVKCIEFLSQSVNAANKEKAA